MINIDDRLFESQINPYQFFLLCQIARFVARDMTCFPSNKKLCEATGWSLSRLNEVKKSLIVDGYLTVKERYNDNKQISNLYSIQTEYLSTFANLKGKGDQDTPTGIPAPTYRDSGTIPTGIPATEPLTNEPLNLHYLPANERLKIWADDIHLKPETKKAYTRGRGLKIENFESDFQKWRAEAEAAPEKYEDRASVVKHFLNHACQEQRQKTYTSPARPTTYAPAKKSHRPEINENYAPKEKQLW